MGIILGCNFSSLFVRAQEISYRKLYFMRRGMLQVIIHVFIRRVSSGGRLFSSTCPSEWSSLTKTSSLSS